ncbi:MAG: hypothetical protein ACYCVY_06865 [Acidiferrobacteraceae bacterium]
MSCRVALRTLAHRGLIELPPAQPASFQRGADAREPLFIGLTFSAGGWRMRDIILAVLWSGGSTSGDRYGPRHLHQAEPSVRSSTAPTDHMSDASMAGVDISAIVL